MTEKKFNRLLMQVVVIWTLNGFMLGLLVGILVGAFGD